MKSKNQSILELLKDEFFIKWVTNPDIATDDYWTRWLLKHPEKKDDVKQAREILFSFKIKNIYKMDQDQYNRILDRIILYQNRAHTSQTNRLSFWYVAASLILLLTVTGIWWKYTEKWSENFADIQSSIKMNTKKVPAGIKYTTKLPDGTMVTLNSLSELTYPNQFSDTIRVVYLEGEAFFEVTQNKNKPFIIKSGYAVTEVLGTSFNIKAYKNSESIEVAVLSGKVKLNNVLGSEQVLSPYEKGVVHQNDTEITKHRFDVKKEIGWKDGILLFEKARFREVVQRLSQWYGVKFEIEPQVKVRGVYSGEFRNETLEDVLSGIAYSSGFQYSIEDKKVYVYE